jgi:organic radical activating enzyme
VSATLPVVEQFGPTIQGEGPAAGQVAWFVRLGGCNLSCSWCDTPYSWDSSRFDLRLEIDRTPVDTIVERIPPGVLVVITGGEPMLTQRRRGWGELLKALRRHACRIHVETNGTIAPDPDTAALVHMFVVSPKLPNAGEHRRRQDPTMHPAWGQVARLGRAHLKVVCRGGDDVARARRLATDHRWPLRQVWAMPEGTTADALSGRWRAVAEAAARQGINASHRLHVLAWDDERGR